jgi:hypothetical protein
MGNVYLLNAWGTDRYKIGITKGDVEKRVKQLQTGCPDEIVICQVYSCKHYRKLESWMHRVYGPKRIEGEWFVLEDEDVSKFINECEKGDETITLLINENPFFN